MCERRCREPLVVVLSCSPRIFEEKRECSQSRHDFAALSCLVYLPLLSRTAAGKRAYSQSNSSSIWNSTISDWKGSQLIRKLWWKSRTRELKQLKITDAYTSCKGTIEDLQGNNNSNKRTTYLPVPRKHWKRKQEFSDSLISPVNRSIVSSFVRAFVRASFVHAFVCSCHAFVSSSVRSFSWYNTRPGARFSKDPVS